MLKPFKIAVNQLLLDDLRNRLAQTRLPPSHEEGWEDGTNPAYLHELIAYWQNGFDWRERERMLNEFTQFRGEVGGTVMHLIQEKGRGPAPMPIILAHGWPDSFYRFHKLIPMLTDPAAHGGDPADAFDVVVPSLPGYGFSERGGPEGDAFGFGTLFHKVMTQELGYQRYAAHGGDVGSSVCEQLARSHPDSVIGIHLTDVPPAHTMNPPKDMATAEKKYLEQVQKFQKDGGGYMHIQGTKPWTPAAGLNDSPAGLAAWIVEKFYGWSDCHGNIESRFSKDELLTNIMLYWTTQTIGSSFLVYRDFTKASTARWAIEAAKTWLGSGKPPAGFALFPKDIATPPRVWAERFFNVQRWTEMPEGGHFAAMEVPERLVEDIRAFFRPLR